MAEGGAVAAISVDGVITSWTRGAARLFGRSFESVLGLDISVVLTGVEWQPSGGSEQAASDQWELSACFRTAPNSPARAVIIRIEPLRDRAQTLIGFRLHFREPPPAEYMAKERALSRYTTEIAHDMNNLLLVAQCHAEFLATTSLSRAQRHELKLAQNANARVVRLARQLLDIDWRTEPPRAACDVNAILHGMYLLFEHALGAGVELRIQPSASVAAVHGNWERLERMIANLIVNARDALTDGGTITIAVEHELIDKAHPLYGQLRGGRYITLSVADTGAGIAPEALGRVFEHGFTTKAPGAGSGVGLSVVQATVSAFSGDVRVESEVGKGSTFIIRLPDASDPGHGNSGVDLPASTLGLRSMIQRAFAQVPARNHVRPVVLVIDDDAALRDSLMRVLAEVEVDAFGVGNPAEALQVLAKQRVDVLVSEQFVGGTDATPFLEEASARFPDTARALLSAHHSPDLIAAAVNRGHVSKVLRKNMHPITIREEIAAMALEVASTRELRPWTIRKTFAAPLDSKSGASSSPR